MRRQFLRLFMFVFPVSAGFFLFCGSPAQGAGDSVKTLHFFTGANSAYKEGHYDAAIENYEKFIAAGFASGNLYYNLGNSYVKKGEFGKAVLNYERARFFIPGDTDLKSNYDYALSSLNAGPRFFGNRFEKLCDRLFEGVTVDSLVIFLFLVYIFVIAAFTLGLFLRGARVFTKPAIMILAVLFVVALVSLRHKIVYLHTGAVVIGKEADVKFEPLESATTYFKLTNGSNAEIIEKSGDWYKIKRPDGKLGWAHKEVLGLIADGPLFS